MCFDLVLRPVENCSVAHSSERHLTVVPNFYKGQEKKPAYLSTFSTQGWKSSDTLGYFKGSDNQKTKTNPEPPDVKHKITQESWKHSPCWVQEELKGGMKPTEREVDGELDVENKLSQLAQEEDEQKVLIVRDSRPKNFTDDSGKAAALVALLKACAKEKDLDRGSKLHADIVERRLHETNLFVSSALVSMYAKCGALKKAQQVFDGLPDRNVVSWNALIAGYVQHGHGEEALKYFEQMRAGGFSPDKVTFACSLRACGSIGALKRGQEIHAQIASEHSLEHDVVVGTALVDMYAKCGALEKAREVFNELTVRNVVSWTALIAGYTQHGHGEEALNCFEQMQAGGLSPNPVTFACLLKACGGIGALQKGQEIHNQVVAEGLLDKYIVVANAVVDMYAKCGALEKAQEVFDKLLVRDVISWNVLITGYAQQGHCEEALNCFDLMQLGGFLPDAVTFAGILKACGSLGALEKGQEVHAQFVRECLLERNSVVANSLVDMYAKCGALRKAHEVLNELQVRTVVSWTALIAGYVQHGFGEEALNCFARMRLEGLSPDAITFACVLKACGSIGAGYKGQEIHAEIVRHGSLENVMVVGTTLVDMYANCGLLAEAQELFDRLPVQDVVSWSALMVGYSQLGKDEVVLNLYDKMVEEGTQPDLVTFTVILNTCSHAGLLDKGQMYFEVISKRYGIIPTLDHHTCVIDLLGRAGHLDQAVAVIKEMPLPANLTLWLTLLGACRKWASMKLGNWVFGHAVRLDDSDHEAYVCLSNIYAAAGRYEDADRIRAMRVKQQGWNKLGHSWWTDASGVIHSLPIGDKRHPQSKDIHIKLECIAHKLEQEGYSLDLHWVSQDLSNDAVKDAFCGHVEKLAIACALISTSEGVPIRVVKNMRSCNDCHSATLLISIKEKRRIYVKDPNGLHIFEDGKCECRRVLITRSAGEQSSEYLQCEQ